MRGSMLSAVAVEHLQSPRNVGPLPDATGRGTVGEPGEGPFTSIWLSVVDRRIARAAYKTHGCPSSVAAASMTAQLVTGRSLEEAALLTRDDLILVLGGLPEGKGHFADFAISALNAALIDTRREREDKNGQRG